MTGQWHGGKGSRPRKQSVDNETFDNNWDRIFGKKDRKPVDDSTLDAYNEERLVSKYDKESKDKK